MHLIRLVSICSFFSSNKGGNSHGLLLLSYRWQNNNPRHYIAWWLPWLFVILVVIYVTVAGLRALLRVYQCVIKGIRDREECSEACQVLGDKAPRRCLAWTRGQWRVTVYALPETVSFNGCYTPMSGDWLETRLALLFGWLQLKIAFYKENRWIL